MDCLLTEKDELVKTQNTLRTQINQLLSNIKYQIALESDTKPIKIKTKAMKMCAGLKNMF